MDIADIIKRARAGNNVIGELRQKSISVPAWGQLQKEYNPELHPVMDKGEYPDITLYEERQSLSEIDEYGNPKIVRVATGVEKVSRVTYGLQALAVKRITELCFGVPVKRIYRPEKDNKKQEQIAKYIEAIYQRARIDSVNIDRSTKLYASCEIVTIWYPVKQQNNLYGFDSEIKLRCKTFSPMQGDTFYPLYDETGDLVALSIAYSRKVEEKEVQFFDTFTSDTHLQWRTNEGGTTQLVLDETLAIGKIPAIYWFRPLPIWDNTSSLVYEMEWAVSRNGNYLRRNSRPILMASVSEDIQFNKAPSTDRAFRDIVHYPQGSDLKYVTWSQAIDNLKFYITELRQMFFTQLQLPDWSYENMKTTPMSGEARKQLFIDCHLKVKDESGRWLEGFDREVNVIKAHLKTMLPDDYAADIDALVVENVITPYIIADESESVRTLLLKNGNKPLMSQRESIAELGESSDVDATMAEIRQESMTDAFEMAL